MAVPVVEVRVVGVSMPQRCMHMRVRMRLTGRGSCAMLVAMMVVVPVKMIVLERRVHMLVHVAFGEM